MFLQVFQRSRKEEPTLQTELTPTPQRHRPATLLQEIFQIKLNNKTKQLQLAILIIAGAHPCTLEYTALATCLSKTAQSSSLPLSWFFCRIAQ
jgi:hypothetical protein